MRLSSLNKTTTLQVTNKSGQNLSRGDVVVFHPSFNEAITVTGSAALRTDTIGVVLEPDGIDNNADGVIAIGGYVPFINLVSGANVGDTFSLASTAKKAIPHSTIQTGDFGQVLATGTAPAAVLWGYVNQGGSGGGGLGYFVNITGTNTTVDPDPAADTAINGLSLTFTTTDTKIAHISVYVKKTSSHQDRYSVYKDGVYIGPPGCEPNNGFYDVSTGEGGIYNIAYSFSITLDAGTHTFTVRHAAVGSTASITFNARGLSVLLVDVGS